MPLLHINNLHLAMRSYEGEAHVLNGVELQVDKGEIWGLAGETGCGKSVTGLSVSRRISMRDEGSSEVPAGYRILRLSGGE